MNYYEHHIGDYAEATAHLSFVEDAAYSRMIRKYYATERPLPVDVKAVQRLVGARAKEEREAVEAILHEFFELQDDGWHQVRCDLELHKYTAKQDKARASANARWSKPHAERNANASTPHMQTDSERNANAYETHNGRNALQSPIPSHQTPIPKDKGAGIREVVPRTPAGEACQRMKAAGLQAVNPSHPKLVALLQAGITLDELADAAADAVAKGKPFAYALATAEGRRRDAATTPLPDKPGPTVPGPSGIDPELARRNAEAAAWKPPGPEVKAMLAEATRRLKGAAA